MLLHFPTTHKRCCHIQSCTSRQTTNGALRGSRIRAEKLQCRAVATAPPATQSAPAETNNGHVALSHGLGDLGSVEAALIPFLLRLAHNRAELQSGDANTYVRESARGLLVWKLALEEGLLPDDDTLSQLVKHEGQLAGLSVESLRWPDAPLRTRLLGSLSQLGVARFCKKYPGVLNAFLRSFLAVVLKYYKTILSPEEEEVASTATETPAPATPAQRAAAAAAAKTPAVAADDEEPEEEELLEGDALVARQLTRQLLEVWTAPIGTLSKASKAFEGLEVLLGGGTSGTFDLKANLWSRKGWTEMDKMRTKLENLKELRDLVRSLGRGGGWGPLRRAPIQYLDERGKDGLLRTILEAQETRGLTRSDDISRLLPSEAATLARGRTKRQAKLLFYAKMAEKALQTYERDGWAEFPTQIVPERREVRPTADRGPILLCVDTSGSMRGPRETVAKALALECMRAAREQERGCYVFAFAGPREVRELELGQDMKSVNNLLNFLEAVFNGGSDFNEPIRRCLDRLRDAKWQNSDILVVSDGELRQPGQEVMQKLSGAKEKLGLRVHALIVGTPEKQRADPAVLKSLCSNVLGNGKIEINVAEFQGWASVAADEEFQFDWDDKEGDARRRAAALALEKLRQAEIKRRRMEERKKAGPVKANNKIRAIGIIED